MHEKDNYLKTAELSTEQNCNMICLLYTSPSPRDA